MTASTALTWNMSLAGRQMHSHGFAIRGTPSYRLTATAPPATGHPMPKCAIRVTRTARKAKASWAERQMIGGALTAFRCPVCGDPLVLAIEDISQGGGRSLKCQAGHNYSIAKEGHVHLLRTGRKKSKKGTKAGDEDGMVRARRAFFDKGHFSHIAGEVAQLVADGILVGASRPMVAVLDAGCGEGYYIGQVQQELQRRGIEQQCFGLDISPLAVRLAARRYSGVNFAVANAFDLPFPDSSLDCVMTLFSPWPVEEFRRVLRRGGFVIAMGPGSDHLLGLKELLYDTPVRYRPRQFGSGTVGGAVDTSDGKCLPPLPQVERTVVRDITVSGEDARNLLQMTPYWWKARPEQQEQISLLPSFSTPLEVRISRHHYP